MRRRALLAGLASLSAGCLGPGTPWGGTTATRSYRVTDLSVSTTPASPSKTFVLVASRRAPARQTAGQGHADVETPVVVRDVDDVERKPTREALLTAIRDGNWHSATLPSGLADIVDHVDFVTDDSGIRYALQLAGPDPLTLDASVPDADVGPDSPGTLQLVLSNTSEVQVAVFSGTVPPFGLVFAEGDPGRFLLWRPYTAEGCVTFDADGYSTCDVGVRTEIAPGGTVTRTYDFLPATSGHVPRFTVPPGLGRYRVAHELYYRLGKTGLEATLSAEVTFTLA